MDEAVRNFVDSWTMAWTLVLALGLIGDFTPWPALSLLREPVWAKAMVLGSIVVVLFLTWFHFFPAALTVTAWAIGLNLIKSTLESTDWD